MAFPDLDRPFLLYCDASAVAAGAVLTQINAEGEEHPLGYYSRAFRQNEINYNNTQREIAAIMLALQHFRHILYGTKVTIFSDNTAAVHLQKRADPLRNTILFQTQFQGEIDYTVKHLPGHKNVIADFLSRFPYLPHQKLAQAQEEDIQLNTVASLNLCSEPQIEVLPSIQTKIQNSETDLNSSMLGNLFEPEVTSPIKTEVSKPLLDWKSKCKLEQSKDSECFPIIQYLKDGTLPVSKTKRKKFSKFLKSKKNQYFISDGLLMFDTLKDEAIPHKVVVPATLQQELVTTYHGSPLAGHPGRDALLTKLQQFYYWRGMTGFISNFCLKCEDCLRFKSHFL